jgi:stage V sporulation protein G
VTYPNKSFKTEKEKKEVQTMPKTKTETAEAQERGAYPPLEYDVKIHSIRPEGTLRGTASANLNGAFAVRGVKITEGTNGLFVSMPSCKAGNGEYKDICFPCTKEARADFDKAVPGSHGRALLMTRAEGAAQEAGRNQTPAHMQTPAQ